MKLKLKLNINININSVVFVGFACHVIFNVIAMGVVK